MAANQPSKRLKLGMVAAFFIANHWLLLWDSIVVSYIRYERCFWEARLRTHFGCHLEFHVSSDLAMTTTREVVLP
jgi:hypothetical protein